MTDSRQFPSDSSAERNVTTKTSYTSYILIVSRRQRENKRHRQALCVHSSTQQNATADHFHLLACIRHSTKQQNATTDSCQFLSSSNAQKTSPPIFCLYHMHILFQPQRDREMCARERERDRQTERERVREREREKERKRANGVSEQTNDRANGRANGKRTSKQTEQSNGAIK